MYFFGIIQLKFSINFCPKTLEQQPDKPTQSSNDCPSLSQPTPETYTNTQIEHSDLHDDPILTNVSKKSADDVQSASTNFIRRRVKCPTPAKTVHNHQPQSQSVLNVANKSIIAKNLHKERLTKALSIKKQAERQHMKRIVFNGTFPIDDPYSSRFETYAEDNEEYDDDEYDENDDGDDVGDDDLDDVEDPYEHDDENGVSIQEYLRDKRYYMNYGRHKTEYPYKY